MWEAVETGAREVGVGKAEGRRSKGRSWKEERGKGQEEEIEKGEDNGGKKGGRGMGDMG